MTATAAELWCGWERSGALRPQDYDADIVEHARSVLVRGGHSASGPIPAALDRAGWTARDLIHTFAPILASFTGMQRDLLRLLERVGASSGTEDNLRVQYEFAEGDLLDESLAAFRETVRRTEAVLLQLRPIAFDARHAFESVLHRHMSNRWIDEFVATTGATRFTWQFSSGVPDPVRTGDPRVDVRADRVIALVREVLSMLAAVADDAGSLPFPRGRHSREPEQDPLGQMVMAARDLWPLATASAVHRWTTRIANGTLTATDELLAAVEAWLDGFEAAALQETTIEQTVDDLTDVLSLPMWGRRHDLYSAWIATQLDRAVDSRFEFVVHNGALRFPFRETLLAHLDTADGPVELWCELRSPATGPLSGGRKANIQPDYRLLRASSGAARERTVAAVEVKQYKAAAGTRHGATLRDYVANLPGATVFLVGHGPLGRNVAGAVPTADRGRAQVHPDVRVGRPVESAGFRADFGGLFPKPPAVCASRIELTWAPTIHDLDLHVSGGGQATSYQEPVTTHSTLRGDERDGGPEVIDLHPGAQTSLEVRVHVYSRASLHAAAPVVTFFAGEERLLELQPSSDLSSASERWWNVGHIDPTGRITPSGQSRVRGGPGAP